jgi:hypothetical protein
MRNPSVSQRTTLYTCQYRLLTCYIAKRTLEYSFTLCPNRFYTTIDSLVFMNNSYMPYLMLYKTYDICITFRYLLTIIFV